MIFDIYDHIYWYVETFDTICNTTYSIFPPDHVPFVRVSPSLPFPSPSHPVVVLHGVRFHTSGLAAAGERGRVRGDFHLKRVKTGGLAEGRHRREAERLVHQPGQGAVRSQLPKFARIEQIRCP